MLEIEGPADHGTEHRPSPTASQRRLVGCALWIVLVFVVSAVPVQAHVALDFPNGGEVLRAGYVAQIVWHDVVSHGPAVYNLWYSTTGPEGPWIVVASSLSASGSYAWEVPDTPSDQVRVRVQQDNIDEDYFDVSNFDLSIVSSSVALPVVLEAERDATIYEEGNANGSGDYFFTGRTEAQNGSAERRALLAFPIAENVPAGATILSVRLELSMSRTISGEQTVELHRALEEWSEGPSDPPGQEGGGATAVAGDVTWTHRNFSQVLWATAGGTFEQSASAALQVGDVGSYVIQSSPGLVADVQGWLADPQSNFGWVLVVDSPSSGSAKRFDSRGNDSAFNRPKVIVHYEAGLVEPTADFSFTPVHPRPGEAVQFSDESTGEPTSWQWDFGDGQTSQQENPNHTYTTSGSKTVTLTVSNSSGSDSTVKTVAVGAVVRRPSGRVAPRGN